MKILDIKLITLAKSRQAVTALEDIAKRRELALVVADWRLESLHEALMCTLGASAAGRSRDVTLLNAQRLCNTPWTQA